MLALRCCALVSALLWFTIPASAQEGQKPADLLAGKWEFKEKQAGKDVVFALVFTKKDDKGGTLKLEVTGAPAAFEGSYTLLKDDEMEVTIKIGNETQKQKLKFKVTKEELTTTDEQGKTERFTRAK